MNPFDEDDDVSRGVDAMHGPRSNRSLALIIRCALAVALAALFLAGTAGPVGAQSDRGNDGERVVLTGSVDVRQGERTDTVVIFDGPAVIAGDVNGAVVAFNGDVRVSGRVDEDVVVFRGRAIIENDAQVGGDVVSSKSPQVAAGATVDGDVRRVNFANYFRSLGWLLWFAWWVAVSVSVFALGVLILALAPRVAPAALDVAHTRVGPAIGWGLAMAIGLPVVCIVVLFTLVGIPLGLIGLLSLALLYGLGYVIAALVLGRRLIREPTSVYLAFLVGLLILRVVDLIPVLGNLITAAATIFGLGALTVAAWRSAHGQREQAVQSNEASALPASSPEL
jgi:hypothetical protein